MSNIITSRTDSIMSNIISNIPSPMETCPNEYFFVVKNTDEQLDSEFQVLKPFIVTNYSEHSPYMSAQYISSLNYQGKHTIRDKMEFYIVSREKMYDNRSYIQSIFDENINDIYVKCDKVYHFHIRINHIAHEYRKLVEDFKSSNASHEQRIIKLENILQDGNKCILTLHMFINKPLLKDDCFVLNNPSFQIC